MRSLKLRDARNADKKVVLDFCRNTWPGYGDFIPQVWDRWIRQRRGRFIVAELEGQPVGIAKITDFGYGEIWLEGLRVDPRHRRKGIARAINREVLRTLKLIKPRVVRFCTAQSNRASRKIGSQYGFSVIARFRYYWDEPRRGRISGEVVGEEDIGAIYDFVARSQFLRLSSGLVAEGWIFREFSRRLLRRYLRRGWVYAVRRRGILRGVAIYPYEESEGGITVGFVDGEEQVIKSLVRNCRYLAARQGVESCSVAVPSRLFPRLVEEAGYSRKQSIGQVVMQYMGRF